MRRNVRVRVRVRERVRKARSLHDRHKNHG